MDFISNAFNGILSFNWEPIFQLTLLALIVISGPAVVFLLALRGGDM
ncbi:MAG: photosystem II reaction center protein Ycf12 [Geitlerinemataceae cyanobacterium]